VIDGVAYDLNDNSGEEDDVILERGLREDVDRTLEHAREHLEPIVHRLFAQTGGRWRERLNTARWQRRGDLSPIPDGHRPFEDRRLVFSTIAYDWSLIATAFIQDPSRPARTLCAISNRYAHEGPRASDPAAARRAFADICAALRPQSVRTALDQSKPLRPSGV
jgi:hypothetical protein